ncbi:hypothetical protein [Citricoccus nitrophenolicus]|uniref:hypothetical protein n=1 Tax=Citricoccus nitrophenolicus TaxID=863575 RepID=UPI0031EE77E7
MPAESASSSSSSDHQSNERKWPLGIVVVFGFLVSCLALGLAIWYFAYQATLGKAPVWWWFPALSQDEMFAVIRNAVTAVAALGIGVTLFLSYRRQRVAERTLELSAQAQLQATKTLELSANTYELTRRQHDAEYENQLRNRYATAAQQIGEGNPSVVIAGCISMATLADEWHRLKRPADRDDCIRMLVAALPEGPRADNGNHLRRSTINGIFEGRMSPTGPYGASWSPSSIDFGVTHAPFGKILGWTITGSVKIHSDQLSLSSETAVVQSTTVRGGRLHIPMNSTQQDYLLFVTLALKNAQLRVDFSLLPALPAKENPSTLVFRNSLFERSSIRIDEPNSPCLPRKIVFEACTFNNRTVRVPRNSSAYEFVFTGCTFADNPFKTVNKRRSPNVGITLGEGNTFVGAMEGFPVNEPAALLDPSSWFFPKGKPPRSGKAADRR